jgi:hypothetical protein
MITLENTFRKEINMYKVTLKGVKELSNIDMDIDQKLEFIFEDFDDCKVFMGLALFYAKNKNFKVELSMEELEDDK